MQVYCWGATNGFSNKLFPSGRISEMNFLYLYSNLSQALGKGYKDSFNF